MPADSATLSALRHHIARLERGSVPGTGHRESAETSLTFGLVAVDRHLPGGGLPAAAMHEIVDGDRDAAATFTGVASAFTAALVGRRQRFDGRPAVWIAPRHSAHESLYRHGLDAFGLDPDRLFIVRVPGHGRSLATQTLWALEECLRERAIGLVCAEIEILDLTASRRLQLAAAAGGTTGLLLRRDGTAPLPPTASVTRWRVTSAPSTDLDIPRWRVELLRARNGRPCHWLLEWRHDLEPDLVPDTECPAPVYRFADARTAAGFALVAPFRDRPDLPQRPLRFTTGPFR
ncbi:MAG: hypothetical protein VW644_08330, partial [Alphaproteobacteria bacterium]